MLHEPRTPHSSADTDAVKVLHEWAGSRDVFVEGVFFEDVLAEDVFVEGAEKNSASL